MATTEEIAEAVAVTKAGLSGETELLFEDFVSLANSLDMSHVDLLKLSGR